MKDIIKRFISKIAGKQRKFFPDVDEKGIAEKPRKFFPVTEVEYLLEQRQKGMFGNGICDESDF